MLDAIRTSSQSWWVRGIFLLLIATFILWGVSSALLPNTTAIATVDGYSITQEQFLRRLNQEKHAIMQENPSITEAMLEQMGIRKQVLNNLIMRYLLLKQAEDSGLFVSDEALRSSITNLPMFKNQEGQFDATTYNTMLKNNKAAVLLFEEDLRNDLLIQKLSKLITDSSFISDNTAKQMYAFLNEERNIEYLFFPAERYRANIEVSDTEKKDFYTKNTSLWQQPHRMHVEYLPITTQSIITSLSIPSKAITEYYTAHKEDYTGMSVAQARSAIALLLKEQQVPNRKEDLVDRVQALRSEGKSLREIAKSINIPVEEVTPLPIDEIEQTIGLPTGSFTKYSNTDSNTFLVEPIPLQNTSDVVFIHVLENTPSYTPPLEKIEAEVEYAVRTEKAIAKAKEEALAIHKTGIFPKGGIKSMLFPRFNPPLELPIRSESFIQDVFTTAQNALLKEVYTTTEGALIAKVDDILNVSETQWEQAKTSFTNQIKNVQGELLFRAFQSYLYTQANIVIVQEALLQPVVAE